MNLHQLMYFQDLSKTLSFSLSAKRMYISQPALSMSISKLESEIGFPLFARRGRELYLTEAGKTFARYTARALDEINFGVNESQNVMMASEPVKTRCNRRTLSKRADLEKV